MVRHLRYLVSHTPTTTVVPIRRYKAAFGDTLVPRDDDCRRTKDHVEGTRKSRYAVVHAKLGARFVDTPRFCDC